MECPNKCGELAEVKGTSMIIVDEELLHYVQDTKRNNVTVCSLVKRICLECGYIEVIELTLPSFLSFIEPKGKKD